MSQADNSIHHLQRLIKISEELRDEGIALYSHEYHSMSFGSFKVEFGRPHYRVLCSWDGKDFALTVSFCEIATQSAARNWTHDATISLPNGEGLYEEIASNVQTMVTT